MKQFILIIIFFFNFSLVLLGQTKLDKTLKTLNKESVPYIYAEELSQIDSPILLDTRKQKEYNVSHIKNARWVGYEEFDIDAILTNLTDKNQEIIVYCSIGVRSENIGEKLLKAGYTNIRNLYGGIFEWKNTNHTIVDPNNEETEKVHTFNKHWGELLTSGEKVY